MKNDMDMINNDNGGADFEAFGNKFEAAGVSGVPGSDVVAFKASAFRSDLIDAARVINFDIEPIRKGYEVLNFPVETDRGVLRMECSFQLMRSADVDGGEAVPVAPSMSGVLKACVALGDMVRIGVDPKDLGRSLKDKGESGTRLLMTLGDVVGAFAGCEKLVGDLRAAKVLVGKRSGRVVLFESAHVVSVASRYMLGEFDSLLEGSVA